MPADNPNIVPHLDDSRAYIYCPRCEEMGYPTVEMRRDSFKFICPLQHELDVHTVQKLVAAGRTLHMVRFELIEQPSPNMVKFSFWIHPATLATLQEKFKGRFISTMDTFFNLVASGDIVFITGEDVKKLKALGINKPQDIIASLEASQDREGLYEALLAKIQPIINAAQSSQLG